MCALGAYSRNSEQTALHISDFSRFCSGDVFDDLVVLTEKFLEYWQLQTIFIFSFALLADKTCFSRPFGSVQEEN